MPSPPNSESPPLTAPPRRRAALLACIAAATLALPCAAQIAAPVPAATPTAPPASAVKTDDPALPRAPVEYSEASRKAYAQGMKDGRKFKAIIPGGSSVPILLDKHLDTPASFDAIQKAGSLLGSAGLIVMDDSVCMVWLAMNLLHFYRHESCGKCTPCREGADWLYKLLQRVERGEGQMKDIDLLYGVANNIVGKTLCAFGDAAATPVLTTINLFKDEFEAHVRDGRCTLPAPWRARHAVMAAH